MTDILDPAEPAHAKARELLETRLIAWITTIDRHGDPHAVPVWFFWHEERIVIFTRADTAKVAHVRRGSPVLVHLDSGAFGNEVVILNGTAEISDRDAASWVAELGDGYEKKYHEAMVDFGAGVDAILAEYSTVIVFTPERLMTW
jgi:PPOX class probable F420-dependent enzyme